MSDSQPSSENNDVVLRRLARDAVKQLATDPRLVIKEFPDFVRIPDEVALDIGNVIDQVRAFGTQQCLTPSQVRALLDLQQRIRNKSAASGDRFWSLASFLDSAEWNDIRIAAGEALSLFQEIEPE